MQPRLRSSVPPIVVDHPAGERVPGEVLSASTIGMGEPSKRPDRRAYVGLQNHSRPLECLWIVGTAKVLSPPPLASRLATPRFVGADRSQAPSYAGSRPGFSPPPS